VRLAPAQKPNRKANVAFANSLLEAELASRSTRKDNQENTARGLVVTAGLVLTLLLGLAKGAGLFSSDTSVVARIALIITVLLSASTAACAMGVLWPRTYERLGRDALNALNNTDFLDRPAHEVAGSVAATRISIAKTMDRHHERKAKWLKWAFRLLAGALAALVVQVVVLVIDPPRSKPSLPGRILLRERAR
jgi:heme A synthase